MSIRHARRCGARQRRTGRPCRQPAMSGSNVCRLHGGKAPQVRRAAARRIAQDEARRVLGVPSEVDPGHALLGQVHEAAGNVEALRALVLEAAPLLHHPRSGHQQTAQAESRHLQPHERL